MFAGGCRSGPGGDDVSLDWTLHGRLRGSVRPQAGVQLAPLAADHLPDLPVRQRDPHLQTGQEREEVQAEGGPRHGHGQRHGPRLLRYQGRVGFKHFYNISVK